MPPTRRRAAAPPAATCSGWIAWRAHGHQCRIVCGAPGEGAELPAARLHRRAAGGRAGAPFAGAARRDSRLPAGLGAGLLRRPRPRPAARGPSLRRRPRGLPGPHAAVFSRSARRVGIPTGTPPIWWRESAGIVAIGRHMAGYVERALGRPAGGDPSAHLRRSGRSRLSPTSSAA